MKKKISTIQILRLVSQLAFLFILPALVGLVFNQIKTLYGAIVNGTFTFSNSLSNFGIIIAVLPLTIILGRFFCGWICAFGALNDFIYFISQKVFKTKIKVDEKVDNILKYIKYFILAFIIVVIWTIGSTAFDTMSPWTAFANILDIKNSLVENIIGFIILAIIIIGAFFIERFFCRYLCPLGAIFTLLSRFRIFNIKKTREKCGACRICTNNCAMGIGLYKTDKVTSGECINCFKCIDSCPRSNTKANICGEDVDSRLAGAVAITAFTGIYSVTTAMGGKTTNNTQNSVVKSNVDSNASSSTSQTTANYKDGTYTGTANGYKPGLTVSVTVTGGKIADIKITAHHESRGFYEKPFETVPQEIIDEQSTNVDVVSGATRSSKGIMNAVANALQNAKIESGSTSSSTAPTESKTEESRKQNQDTKTESSNNNTSTAKNQENTTENKANSSTNTNETTAVYKDGTYTGTARGYKPGLTVSVTVTGGKIADIKITSHNESRGFYEQPFQVVPQEIIDEQSTDVDAVSGATRSSKGIMTAVANALQNAKQ